MVNIEFGPHGIHKLSNSICSLSNWSRLFHGLTKNIHSMYVIPQVNVNISQTSCILSPESNKKTTNIWSRPEYNILKLQGSPTNINLFRLIKNKTSPQWTKNVIRQKWIKRWMHEWHGISSTGTWMLYIWRSFTWSKLIQQKNESNVPPLIFTSFFFHICMNFAVLSLGEKLWTLNK